MAESAAFDGEATPPDEVEIDRRILEHQERANGRDLHVVLGWTRDELTLWMANGEVPPRALPLVEDKMSDANIAVPEV